MLTVLAAIFVFGVLVTVHEFGHFITAKMTGMHVEEFAIGFGPKLYQQREGETLYTLRAIPLGGFNRIAGMDPEDEENPEGEDSTSEPKPVIEKSRLFNNRPIPARMLVILAGALMNFLLPIFLFTGVFCVKGMDMPLTDPVIGQAIPFMAADNAGIKAGDKILTINNQPIAKWSDVQAVLKKNGMNEATVVVNRAGEEKTFKMQPQFNKEMNKPMIGISPKTEHRNLGFGEAFLNSFVYEKFVITSMIVGLYQLITGSGSADLSGPIGVAKMAGEVAQVGIVPLLNFTAFLSINLGIINLLPLPALDGGHFILLVLEAIRRKPLGAKAMQNIQMVGICMILALTLFSTFKDLTR